LAVLSRFRAHRDLHSFPTRRSSDLIFVSLGDRAANNFESYNRLLFKNEHGILPAELVKKIPAPPDHHFTLNAQDDQFLEPPLKADRKSTRLNSSHLVISYAVFCLKK